MKAKAITKENKEQWLEWIESQLDKTKDAQYHNMGTNRVFLTKEDDIDIAKYLLKVMKKTAESL